MLRSVDAPIVDINECQKMYQEAFSRNWNVTIGHICAGKLGKQSCSVRFRMQKC